MQLSQQFPELFRDENYAVNLALVEERQLDNPFEAILASRPINGVWDKEYSVVPMGALEGRKEGEDIAQKNMTMGYTCYGGIAIEASGKVGVSKILKQRSKEFKAAGGGADEPKFAGFLADTASRAFMIRSAQKKRRLSAKIFNYGGIQAGDGFYNHRDRTEMSDVPDSNLIYDDASHMSYASGASTGVGSAATGNYVDHALTLGDTGGYFNAFQFPPSYWALKRVMTHFKVNMQYDENDEPEDLAAPELVLLVSDHNIMKWTEILQSKFIEPNAAGSTTNIENVFMFEGFRVRLVSSRDLIKNTWFLGQPNSQGILLLNPTTEEDPWAYWRDEKDRSYWVSYEAEWGFMIRNWRRWVAGSISTDGTADGVADYGDETSWDQMPAGV